MIEHIKELFKELPIKAENTEKHYQSKPDDKHHFNYIGGNLLYETDGYVITITAIKDLEQEKQ